MESPVAVDPILTRLAASRSSLKVCGRIAVVGLVCWLLFLVAVALQCHERVGQGRMHPLIACLVWSLFGVPVLLHIWPILALRRASQAMADFVDAPNEVSAAMALRAQVTYWKAAALFHLTLIAWVLWVMLLLSLAPGLGIA
jgi:hypothetical protein